jgi:hypothetical protein
MYYSLLAGVIGIIINYTVINYGIPMVFPSVYSFNSIKHKLDVSKVAVPLTIGSCNFDSSTLALNTSNPYKDGFIFMPNSNNLKGGSQFSYTFWLDIKSGYAKHLNNVNIFMRGNKNIKTGVLNIDQTTSQKNTIPLVVCPLVKFSKLKNEGSDDRVNFLEIFFNTLKNPHNKIVINEDVYKFITSSNSNPKWFLVTITFQDYVDFSNAEKGIQIQNYINDNLVSTKILKNDTLKTNNGNVFLTPNFNEEDTQIEGESFYSDLTYFNYALDIIEIENIYKRGINDASGQCVTAKYSSKNNTKDYYHKLSMNNYL